MHTLQERFGVRLKALRRRMGLTQEMLAERIDVSADLVSMIERGRVAPSFRTLERLAHALGVHVYELFMFTEQEGREA
jgi:transcriptional regulator with XRE-family HTH domain